MSTGFSFGRALVDPASVFSAPNDVLNQAGLKPAQRIEILRRWQYDANQVAVAEEEGMPGNSPLMVRSVALALNALTDGVDCERLKTTKLNCH